MKSDVVIIGAGPGGTASAIFLAQRGIQSTIIEKASFPRYHVGESMTGECGACLRAMGLEQEMLDRKHPIKWGVKVYEQTGKNSFYVPVMSRGADNRLEEAFTWQVRRSEFDAMLLNKAVEMGAEVVPGQATAALRDNGCVNGVRVKMADGGACDIRSRVVIDASGMATFLCNAGVTSEKYRGKYDKQVAFFSQVAGVIRDPGKGKDDTLIFYQRKNHWAWLIPLDEELVSVGVVVPSDRFLSTKESKQEFLAREIRELNPQLSRRIPEIRFAEEVRAISNYSYHIKQYTGKNYLCVGDAHRFIDPVFSFGLYFSIKEAQRAALDVADYLGGANPDAANPFADFQRHCERGMDVIEDLLDAFWDHPFAFSVFAHSRYVDDLRDLFAGRVYSDEPSPGLLAIQGINEKGRKMNRSATTT